MNKTALRYGFYLNRKENEVKKKEYQYTPRRKYKSAWIKTFDSRRKCYSVKSKTFDGCGNFKSMRIIVFDGWRKSESAWIRTFLAVGKKILRGITVSLFVFYYLYRRIGAIPSVGHIEYKALCFFCLWKPEKFSLYAKTAQRPSRIRAWGCCLFAYKGFSGPP